MARRAIAACLIASCLPAAARAQAVLVSPSASDSNEASADLRGIRPEHLWSAGYPGLVLGDAESIFTAPARWDQDDWAETALAVSAVGAAAAFDRTIRTHVQANRTKGEDRFMKQFRNFDGYYSFGALAAFDALGELGGDVKAKNAAMDGLASSIIAAGLITPTLKLVVGRERPTTTSSTFRFRPFSGNYSFPSGESTQAFAVATAIAENYPTWWVEGLVYGYAGLVGYERIEQNAHFASDVVAGSIIGWSVARGIVHRNDTPNPKKLSWTPYANGREFGVVFFRSF